MQTKCTKALGFLVQCIRDQSLRVDSLIHDGCHVRKEDGKEIDISVLNEAFKRQYKHGRIKIKPFEPTVNVDDFTDLLPYRREFNNIILKEAPLTRDDIIPDENPRFHNQSEYLKWQTDLVAKMNTQVAYITSKSEFMVKTGSTEYEVKRSKHEAMDYFADFDIAPTVANKPMGTINAFGIWLKSKDRLKYNKKVFNPRPLDHVDAAKSNEFNVLKGFLLTHEDVKDDGGDPGAFIDHITRVWCRNELPAAKCVQHFFAQMLQTPWERVDWGLYVRGEQGSMKNFVLDHWIKKIMGNAFFGTHEAEKIFGRFNKHIEGKILICNDEAISAYDKKAMSQLKGFTTSNTVMIDAKNKAQYEVEALHRLITFSNYAEYANVGKGQRRGFFLETDDMYSDANCPYGSDRAANRNAHITWCLGCSPKTVAKYLYELDISDFNPRRVIHTRFEQQQIEGNLSPVESFALGIIRDDVYFMSGMGDAYDLKNPIPKDTIFEMFKSQNSAQTRHYGKPKFWKEFKRVFPSAHDCKINRVPCILFRRERNAPMNSEEVTNMLKDDFRTCVRDPHWTF